jgi:hypothetical protein
VVLSPLQLTRISYMPSHIEAAPERPKFIKQGAPCLLVIARSLIPWLYVSGFFQWLYMSMPRRESGLSPRKRQFQDGEMALFGGHHETIGMGVGTVLIQAGLNRCLFPCGQKWAEFAMDGARLGTERER